MSRAEVVDEREAVAARDGGDLLEPRPLLEADDAEVRLVDAEDDRRLGPDRALVVRGARPVRRPDLDEPRAGAGQDVGDPEAVADLDQLAARDDDLASLRQRSQREEDCGGVVVDDEGGLRACQPAQHRRDVVLARASRALGQVVLEVRVAARDLGDPLDRLLGERGAAEIRVDDDSRRVEHALEPWPPGIVQLLAQPRREIARIPPGLDLLARPVDDRPGCVHRERVARLARELVDRRQITQLHRWTVTPVGRVNAGSKCVKQDGARGRRLRPSAGRLSRGPDRARERTPASRATGRRPCAARPGSACRRRHETRPAPSRARRADRRSR